jgi:hypothetical protein
MAQDHWLDGFNYNVEEWDAAGLHYETLFQKTSGSRTALSICHGLKPL